MSKVWFVTGASAGFGRAVTEHALQQGDSVVATLSRLDVLSDLLSKYSSRLLLLPLDVREPEQIHAAFENALRKFGHVDIVFNNAEFCIVGGAEGMSEEHGRELFEVLFWGAAIVSKEAVKIFRDRNHPSGGRLLQMSSRTALQVVPGVAYYAAAKTALECLSDGLAGELDPSWNIKISIIQPALFRTNATWDTAVDPIYPPSRPLRGPYPGGMAVQVQDGDPRKFARAMYRLAYMNDPPRYLPLHRVAIEAAKAKGEELIQTAKHTLMLHHIWVSCADVKALDKRLSVLSAAEKSVSVWFVTGASTGFGRLVTERALDDGDVVVATLRNPSKISDLSIKYPISRLLVLQLDVNDSMAITNAFKQAVSAFDRVDVVFNNAGFYGVGEVEGFSDKISRAIFDTVFWGASNVMKEAVKCFRDNNRPMGGQLLNVSSRTALVPQPGGTLYAAAKAALESLTEGYAAEIDPKWNIRLILLEPGLFRTAAVSNCIIEPPLPAYASNPSLPTMKYRALYPTIEQTHFDGNPKKFAELACRLVRMEDLPSFTRLPVHRVALDSARKKGEMLVEAAEKLAGWSDDIYLDLDDNQA